jgi:hypothetical protein
MMFMPMGYWLFMLPALALAGLATLFTQSAFRRYSRVASRSGMTGAEAAAALLHDAGVAGVRIEQVAGFLSDHYDPSSLTLRLSPGVFGSTSLSAIGVACHEAGHALQHARRYAPLMLRSAMVPATQIGSHMAYIVMAIGMMMQSPALMQWGVLLFGLAVVFAVVTLPVEWDATARAKRGMVAAGIVTAGEAGAAGRVLNAAFLTYVAGAFTAIMTFLYYLLQSGLLGGGRRSD